MWTATILYFYYYGWVSLGISALRAEYIIYKVKCIVSFVSACARFTDHKPTFYVIRQNKRFTTFIRKILLDKSNFFDYMGAFVCVC